MNPSIELSFRKIDSPEFLQYAYQADIIRDLNGEYSSEEEEEEEEYKNTFRGKTRAEDYGYLGTLNEYYKACLLQDKSKCKYYPWVRFHYADTRFYGLEVKDYYYNKYGSVLPDLLLMNDYTIPITLAINSKNEGEIKEFCDVVRRVLNIDVITRLYLSKKNPFDVLREVTSISSTSNVKDILIAKALKISNLIVIRKGKPHHRTCAEFLHLEEENPVIAKMLRNYVHEYIQGNYLKHKEYILGIVDNLERNIDRGSSFQYILGAMSFLSIWNMDIYTISRMLLLKDSPTVIYYAGNTHRNNVSNFFSYIQVNLIHSNPLSFVDDANGGSEERAKKCFNVEGSSIPSLEELRRHYK